jgi:hypothetical protein
MPKLKVDLDIILKSSLCIYVLSCNTVCMIMATREKPQHLYVCLLFWAWSRFLANCLTPAHCMKDLFRDNTPRATVSEISVFSPSYDPPICLLTVGERACPVHGCTDCLKQFAGVRHFC